MKRLSLSVLTLLVSTLFVMGQSKQDGFVKEYNETSEKKPLAGVQLLVSNANHDVSGEKGDFHLTFRTLKPGDLVHVHNIIKSGYEIFNKEQLEVWRIAHNNEPFTIVMCKSSMLRALKDEYNAISYKSYDEQMRKELKVWEDKLKEGAVKEAEYEKQTAAICEYYEKKLDNLDTYIDRFARIDLGQVTREERRIVDLVRKGMIQEAIDEYNALRLDEALIKNYQEYQKADAAIKDLTKVSQDKHTYEEELLTSLNNKFSLMMMQGSREAIDNILDEFEKVAEKCPQSLSILRSFVEFADREMDYRRVSKWGRILIEITPDDKPLLKQRFCMIVRAAERWNENFDQVNLYTERISEWLAKAMEMDPSSALRPYVMEEADKMSNFIHTESNLAECLQKSDNLIQFLDSIYAVNHTEEMRYVYLISMNLVYFARSEIFIKLNDFEKVIQYNEKQIECIDSLLLIDSSDFVKGLKADTYNTAGYYYILAQDLAKADKYLSEANSIFAELFATNPYKYFAGMNSSNSYRGMVYFYSGNLDKSKEVYQEAIKISGEVIDTRPYPTIISAYAELYNNLGYLCFIAGDDKTAEESFNQCIEKISPFAEKNPYLHLSTFCTAQINLGTLLLKQGRLEDFESLQSRYFANVEKVYRWDGLSYASSYAIALDNKGYYALLQNDTESALVIWKQINELVPGYLNINPTSFLYAGLKERKLIE